MDDGRQIMYIQDGGVGERFMQVGSVQDLANEVKVAEYTYYEVGQVYALDQMGEVKPVAWSTEVGEFDEHGFAGATVEVVFPDGGRESTNYRVDGNA